MFNEIVGAITAASVVVSLLFVGWQTRELSKQTKINNAISITSTYAGCAQLMTGVHAPMLTNPALRPYFYDGKPCESDDENRQLILTMAELFADAAEFGLMAAKQAQGVAPLSHYQDYLLQNSPCLRNVVTAHPNWWPELATLLAQTRNPAASLREAMIVDT